MKFTKPKKVPLPKQARSIPYKSKGDERLWKCWNCGFIVDEDKYDSSGLMAGDSHIGQAVPSFGGEGKSGMIIPTEVGRSCVLMEQDASGTNKTIKHVFVSRVTRGCPFCGSTNYKG